MKKNTSGQFVGAQIINATTGAAFTGAVTAYVTGNAGTQAIGSVGAGACVHEGNGFHTYAPAQAETNFDHVAFTFIGTGAIPATVQVYPNTGVVTGGTAQAGAAASITLAAAASAVNGTYDPALVQITGGTGSGQARLILQYDGATRVASVDRDWRVVPDLTSEYQILASANLMSTNEGLAQAGGASTITLNASASAVDNTYTGQTVVLRTGTGQDQSRVVASYVGLTKVATMALPWETPPVAGTGYMMLPFGRASVVSMGAGVLTAAAIATDAFTAAKFAPDVTTELQAGLATAAEVAAIKVKTDFLPSAVAGAAGGVFIAGSNAATSITTGLTANIVGNLSGSVGSVTGLTAANLDVAVSSRMATFAQPTGFLAAAFPLSVASPTNITAGTITNLTNAPTTGDLTATMKASVTTAATAATPTAAAVTGAVGSVTGLTASNLDAAVSSRSTYAGGAVASVTAGVTVTTNNDKAGYALSAAGVQAVWDALTSALLTVNSIGKKLADWVIGSSQTGDAFARLGVPTGASLSADVAAVKADGAAIKVKTDFLPSAVAGAAGGVFIAGSNAATSITTGLTANIVGSVTGAVGSVTGLTTMTIADQVWDEIISGHAIAGSTGAALSAAGGSGDPWSTALPGVYAAGTAGNIVGAIKTKTDALPVDPADASDIAASFVTVNGTLAAIAGYIDTEVAAIKAKTDNLPAAPAAAGDIPPAATVATAVWAAVARTLTAGTNIVLAKGTGVTGFNDLGAAAVAGAVLDEPLSAHTAVGSVGLAARDVDLRGSRTVVRGTAGAVTAPTTTQFTPSALSPAGAAAGQFKGRIIIWDNDTATLALRGQATDITASSAAALPLLTFTALTTAPVSGDTFSVL